MKKYLLGLLVVLIFSIITTNYAHASTLTGWAWSETFGWISFNSTDSGAGGGPYSVTVDDTTGNWSGYAWSEYLGWISFNVGDANAAACPGTRQVNLNKTTGEVVGDAYALVYGTSQDGCIELSGGTHPSPGTGVTLNTTTGKFTGFAWAGDVTNETGPGWIDFGPSIGTPVTCGGCVGGGTITGTCTATSPYQNVAPNTSVSFQAAGTSGTAPYTYNWNGAGFAGTNSFSASYSSSAAGPTVIIKDSLGGVTNTISCPNVTVLNPIGTSNLQIGKNIAAANSTTYTVRQASPFTVVWNMTLSDDYSCSTSLSPNPGNANWTTHWVSRSLGGVSNGDGTKTWAGNTGDSTNGGYTLTAGTSGVPITPGIYSFGAVCTSGTNPTQTTTVQLKVNSASVNEI